MSVERWQVYALELPESGHVGELLRQDNVIQIQALPGPFFLRGLETTGVSSGKEIRCRDGRGDYFQSDLVRAAVLSDTNYPLPIWPALEYPFNGVFRFDLLEPETEGPESMWMVLYGAHKIADPSGPSFYPENYRETPFTIQVDATLGALGRAKLPIKVQFNTPFVIRQLLADFSGDVDSAGTVVVQLRDESGQAFFNTEIPLRAAFGLEPSHPVTPSPELIIPAGRAFTLEIRETAGQGPTPLQFNFGGALLSAV